MTHITSTKIFYDQRVIRLKLHSPESRAFFNAEYKSFGTVHLLEDCEVDLYLTEISDGLSVQVINDHFVAFPFNDTYIKEINSRFELLLAEMRETRSHTLPRNFYIWKQHTHYGVVVNWLAMLTSKVLPSSYTIKNS